MWGKIALLVTLCFLLCLNGCVSTEHYETDPSNYGSWDKTVTEIRRDFFHNSLPAKRDVDQFAQSYYYVFTQGLLGDPNFVISVALQFPDETSYEEELTKYSLELSDTIVLDGTTYYLVQCTLTEIEEYTDERIYDGMYYSFEIIAGNKEAKTIRFINARV